MAQVCCRHPFEHAATLCSSCGAPYCLDCLVFPRGPKKAALCVQCAIAVSGVRSAARVRPERSKRAIRKERKQHERASQEQAPERESFERELFDDSTFAYAPQPITPAPAPKRADAAKRGESKRVEPEPDSGIELTSAAEFDPGWAVNWQAPDDAGWDQPEAEQDSSPFSRQRPALPRRPAVDSAPPEATRVNREAGPDEKRSRDMDAAPKSTVLPSLRKSQLKRAAGQRDSPARANPPKATEEDESTAMLSWIDNLMPSEDRDKNK